MLANLCFGRLMWLLFLLVLAVEACEKPADQAGRPRSTVPSLEDYDHLYRLEDYDHLYRLEPRPDTRPRRSRRRADGYNDFF